MGVKGKSKRICLEGGAKLREVATGGMDDGVSSGKLAVNPAKMASFVAKSETSISAWSFAASMLQRHFTSYRAR